MGLLDDKVAFVTGAGRSMGRSHAVRLASEGADVAILDLGDAGVVEHYRTATAADIEETERLVIAEGRRALSFQVDVRDLAGLEHAAERTALELGGIDFVVANAGIVDRAYPLWEIPAENWQTMLDVNLTGVFHTCRATIPHVRRRGPGGALVLISSVVGIKPYGPAHYAVAKMGVRALSLALARELGPDGIRCNSIHPGAIETAMADEFVRLSGLSSDEHHDRLREGQHLQEPIEMKDISAAVLWLVSPESRFVTGLEMTVDGGETKK
jgi:NAD(P)-dependent dehydrogenase (short-subunit alcohol dehydrogenase family)